jgi:large conductance mechanosensitive channel
LNPYPQEENAMGMMKEFKDFAAKGNMLDMAIGIIVGAAFGKVISSLVSDVIMPPIGLIIGGVDFKALKLILKQAAGETAAVTLNYGVFIQTIVDFLIVSFAIFLLVKGVNTMRKKQEETPAAPPAPSNQEILLGEIRDVLKSRSLGANSSR